MTAKTYAPRVDRAAMRTLGIVLPLLVVLVAAPQASAQWGTGPFQEIPRGFERQRREFDRQQQEQRLRELEQRQLDLERRQRQEHYEQQWRERRPWDPIPLPPLPTVVPPR